MICSKRPDIFEFGMVLDNISPFSHLPVLLQIDKERSGTLLQQTSHSEGCGVVRDGADR